MRTENNKPPVSTEPGKVQKTDSETVRASVSGNRWQVFVENGISLVFVEGRGDYEAYILRKKVQDEEDRDVFLGGVQALR